MATYGPDGLPTLSWRVALLPYLGEETLYRQFHQDEPWDSPHNKALAARMPAVFETPVSPAPPGQTRIRGFAGKGTIFDGQKGVRFADIWDGTSNTLLVAIADEATPWTKPGELLFVEGAPCRRWITAIRTAINSDWSTARSVCCPFKRRSSCRPSSRGRVARSSSGRRTRPAGNATTVEATPTLRPTPPIVPPTPVGAVMGSMSNMTPTPSLEQRMQRLEEKLELILKRLDALGHERPK